MQLIELSDYIGSLLDIIRYRDYAPNGIQVEGRKDVKKIATGVTASQQILEKAVIWGADAIIVHHGYFWQGEDPCLTGIKKQRLEILIKHNISLLAYHLPLDSHPLLGNNMQLAQQLELIYEKRFGEQNIACFGNIGHTKTLKLLSQDLEIKLQRKPLIIGNMETVIKKIAWCTGAGQSFFEQSIQLGAEAYLTGEISEKCVHIAQETGIAYIAAGHHATERYGVQALGKHLSEHFGLEHQFFDQENPV